MVFIAMLLGLRASEILGLRWEDIDLRRGTLSVCRSHVGKRCRRHEDRGINAGVTSPRLDGQ